MYEGILSPHRAGSAERQMGEVREAGHMTSRVADDRTRRNGDVVGLDSL